MSNIQIGDIIQYRGGSQNTYHRGIDIIADGPKASSLKSSTKVTDEFKAAQKTNAITPVYAAYDGVVIKTVTFDTYWKYDTVGEAEEAHSTGIEICIQSPNKSWNHSTNTLIDATNNLLRFTYMHLCNINEGIVKGVSVKAGQLIGWVGDTGNSTEPHLHFEIYTGSYLGRSSSAYQTTLKKSGRALAERNSYNQLVDPLIFLGDAIPSDIKPNKVTSPFESGKIKETENPDEDE